MGSTEVCGSADLDSDAKLLRIRMLAHVRLLTPAASSVK
jgi:hypothetical protein